MQSALLHAGYLSASLLASLAFYLATPHQRLWPVAARHGRKLRLAGAVCCAASAWAAVAALGIAPGLFAALTALMLWAVALPYLDAWRSLWSRR